MASLAAKCVCGGEATFGGRSCTSRTIRQIGAACSRSLANRNRAIGSLSIPSRARRFASTSPSSRSDRLAGERCSMCCRLGDFTETQQKVVDQTTEFMGIYFGLPVKTLPALPLKVIPASAKRVHPQWGDDQILSTYVLDKVLKPRLPTDGCVLIALTASDLWPGKGWNFVFGQASLSDRVGVWSIYRNGDPGRNHGRTDRPRRRRQVEPAGLALRRAPGSAGRSPRALRRHGEQASSRQRLPALWPNRRPKNCRFSSTDSVG